MKTPVTKLIAAWAVSALMALQSTVYAADQTVQTGDSAAPEVSVGTDAVTEQISDDVNVSTNDINNSEGDLTETIRLPSCAQINQAICKSTQDPVADGTYDIDGNGVINAFDNVLRKRQLLESQSEYAHLFVSKAVGYGGDVVPVTATTTTIPLETMTTTTVTTTSTGPKGQIYDGIDVSKWQGTVDWAKVKADGYHFAIIRAGYGREASQVDPTFATNVAGAKKAGLYCGAYWYSYATDAAGAKAEAELFLKTVKGYQFDFPLVFDIEDSTQQSLSKSTVAAIIDTFCNTVENAGYYCTLYSYASFLTNNVPVSCQSEHDIWVAHTKTEKPAFSRAYGMWQYSHTGTVNGVSGSTDLNYAYKDYPAIMQKYGFNGFKGQ